MNDTHISIIVLLCDLFLLGVCIIIASFWETLKMCLGIEKKFIVKDDNILKAPEFTIGSSDSDQEELECNCYLEIETP